MAAQLMTKIISNPQYKEDLIDSEHLNLYTGKKQTTISPEINLLQCDESIQKVTNTILQAEYLDVTILKQCDHNVEYYNSSLVCITNCSEKSTDATAWIEEV